jgi:hypothetical protein
MKYLRLMRIAAIGLASLSATAFAQDAAFELPRTAYIKDYESFKLAVNDTDVSGKKPSGTLPQVKNNEFEPSWFTGGKTHQYLGLATLAAAGLTAMTAPDSGCDKQCKATTTTATRPARETNGTHAQLAKTTIALAAATIATGLIVHWDDFHLADGISDPDNLHVLLGVTGAALMAYAVNKSKNSAVPVSHAGIAEMGALGMVVAVKLTW